MREVALDTETTGLNPKSGDRIVEIGCVELMNHMVTGNTYQCYLNPEMTMPEQAFAVHGLSDEFLSDKPAFAEVADDFLDFLDDSQLIIHNADFDMGFINAELTRVKRPALSMERVIDTVKLARRKFPGAQANLDALCRRFQIDLSDRTLHGALLDSQLLAAVYLELIGGRQPGLELVESGKSKATPAGPNTIRPPRPHSPTAEEKKAHADFLDKLESPIWLSRDKT